MQAGMKYSITISPSSHLQHIHSRSFAVLSPHIIVHNTIPLSLLLSFPTVISNLLIVAIVWLCIMNGALKQHSEDKCKYVRRSSLSSSSRHHHLPLYSSLFIILFFDFFFSNILKLVDSWVSQSKYPVVTLAERYIIVCEEWGGEGNWREKIRGDRKD